MSVVKAYADLDPKAREKSKEKLKAKAKLEEL